MEVNDLFPYATLAGIDSEALFTPLPAQTVQAKQIAVSSLQNVFLSIVPVQGTEVDKIRGLGNRRGYGLLCRSQLSAIGGREEIEEALGLVVAEADDWLGWKRISDRAWAWTD